MSTIDLQSAPTTIKEWLERVRPHVERALAARLRSESPAQSGHEPVHRLWDAMRYAALGPGKRLRPALVVAACEACGGSLEQALSPAVAVELLHAYTLVHDDLPAMDDDDERRGRKTVHIAFDEATAILAGDGLLTLAFQTLAELGPAAGDAIAVLGARAGADELLAGQMLDLASTGETALPLPVLERMHAGKTGALFAASTELGAIAASATAGKRRALRDFGMAVGIAFQHADDLDDGDFSGAAREAQSRRSELCRQAEAALAELGASGQVLTEFARWIGSATPR